MDKANLKATGPRPGTNRRRVAGERTRRAPSTARPTPPARRFAPRGAQPPAPAPTRPAASPGGPTGSGPFNLLLAVLAVLAAALVAAAAYFAVPAWQGRAVQDAQHTAPSVAERAAKAILSYDYRSLTHDEKTAGRYLTPAYWTKYEHTFDRAVKSTAPGLHAKVTAEVLGSGIAQADADHAHVLLFVNQTTRSNAHPGQPQVALNRVMLDMVRRGGTWLVNGITAY